MVKKETLASNLSLFSRKKDIFWLVWRPKKLWPDGLGKLLMKKNWIGSITLLLSILLIGVYQADLGLFPKWFSEQKESNADSLSTPKEQFLYGINVTGLNIVEGTVAKNQTLATLPDH
jgi:hypothetical protein